MQLLPHQPADELVTISYFQTEMGAFRAEMRGEMHTEFAAVRGEMADLRVDFERRFSGLDTKFTRLWVTSTVANAIAVITALLT